MDAFMFKRIRMGLGLSQAEMAERIGCSLNYVQQMESGSRPISFKMEVLTQRALEAAVREGDPFLKMVREIKA